MGNSRGSTQRICAKKGDICNSNHTKKGHNRKIQIPSYLYCTYKRSDVTSLSQWGRVFVWLQWWSQFLHNFLLTLLTIYCVPINAVPAPFKVQSQLLYLGLVLNCRQICITVNKMLYDFFLTIFITRTTRGLMYWSQCQINDWESTMRLQTGTFCFAT